MTIAVVIPARNEARNIESVLQRLNALQCPHSILPIVVDDGSRDKTRHIAKRIPNVMVLHHRINLGKGAAAKTGCDAAYKCGADVIALMDGDGQHNPEDLIRLLKPLVKKQDADMVIGSRSISPSMPVAMRVGNIVLTGLCRLLFRIRIQDTQSGYRVFKRHIYPRIRWESANYAMETEMLLLASRHRLKVTEMAIDTVYLDSYKGTTVLDGLRIVKTMVTWRLMWFRASKSSELFSV